jgi:hypothetical protein
MKKEFYKEPVPKSAKDVDTLGNIRASSPSQNQQKVKPHKLPDLRDIDDFESLLGEAKENKELPQALESQSHTDTPQGSALEHQAVAQFSNQKDQGNEQRRSAGLDIFLDAKSEDSKSAAGVQTEASNPSQLTPVETAQSGWETYEIELPSLGTVCLSLLSDASGLCFRLSSANPAIEELLSEKTQKIERQLGDILKKKVRFIGSERS